MRKRRNFTNKELDAITRLKDCQLEDAKMYYEIEDDLRKYPDAWIYVVFGGRAVGKTYGALKYVHQNKIPFIYAKRNDEDVKILTAGNSKTVISNANNGNGINMTALSEDLSPFKALNRDFGWNVRAFNLMKGVGAFYDCDEHNVPILDDNGNANSIGKLVAISMLGKYRGMDMSDTKIMILDEFVPGSTDKIMSKEGQAILDLYMTVARDNEVKNNADPLKLICFSNANNIVSPLVDTLEIMDDLAEMERNKEEVRYLEKRGILIRKVKPSKELYEKQHNMRIAKGMADTRWFKASFENDFAFNDFSKIRQVKLTTAHKLLAMGLYQRKPFYIYKYPKADKIYITDEPPITPIPQDMRVYNLDVEGDTLAFAKNIRGVVIAYLEEDDAVFNKYSLYDMMVNLREKFDIIK